MPSKSSHLDNETRETTATSRKLAVWPTRPIVRLQVHTSNMRRLLLGRPAQVGKPAIIGLYGFADRLREIWDAANKLDPFAVWWLVKIEAARKTADSSIELEKATVRRAIESMAEFDIQFAANESVESIELKFACPYAYQVARVLKSFDELALATSTAEQLGAMPPSSHHKNRFRCERPIRHLLTSAHGFHALGVKPADIQQQSTVAIQAQELMGEVPEDILSGVRRPELLMPRVDPELDSATGE